MAKARRGQGMLYLRGEVWWIKYYLDGRPQYESTGKRKEEKQAALDVLNERLGRKATGQPILPRVDRIRYEEVAEDLRREYETKGRRNPKEAGARFAHLKAFFRGWRIARIDDAAVTAYVERRQKEGAATPRLTGRSPS